MTEPFHRELFHCCALTAWLEVAVETGQYPPDAELTRQRAYALYETELRRENHQESAG